MMNVLGFLVSVLREASSTEFRTQNGARPDHPKPES